MIYREGMAYIFQQGVWDMFIVSIKTSKKKLIAAAALLALSLCMVVFSPVVAREASADMDKKYIAANPQERINFLAQYGWQVNEEPVEVVEIIVPYEFSAVYENYNKIQAEDGFDLKKYCGKRLKRWTYQVVNYPGYEGTDLIYANLLIYEGRVVGGDICNVELDGFMHCFTPPENLFSSPESVTS